MRGRTWLVLLSVAGALLVVSATGLAQSPSGGLAEAAVDVTVEPAADSVQEAGSIGLDIHVIGGLTCSAGMPPAPLVGTLLPEGGHEGLDLVFQPEQVQIDWEPAGATGTVEYRVNETVSVVVGVVSATQPVVTRFHVLFAADGGDDAGCTPQGYQVTQNEREGGAVTVEPALERTQEGAPAGAAFNWVPLVLAVALLGLVSVFAYQREKRRR